MGKGETNGGGGKNSSRGCLRRRPRKSDKAFPRSVFFLFSFFFLTDVSERVISACIFPVYQPREFSRGESIDVRRQERAVAVYCSVLTEIPDESD